MRRLPFPFGPLHFVGIGGIGMSGIAELLYRLGCSVSGSDAAASANTARLEALGLTIRVGHDADNLGEAAAVVLSTAVPEDNPELQEARRRGLPVLHRSEALAAVASLSWPIAVSGTHGKTTTTAMIAAVLEAGGLDPTIVNGGILEGFGSNAKLGRGDWVVIEADESDRSFLNLPATLAVVTNIEAEHMEHYRDLAEIEACFAQFADSVPPFGSAIVSVDNEGSRRLAARCRRPVLRYGFTPDADIRGGGLVLEAASSWLDVSGLVDIADLRIGVPGRHNAENALAAVSVGHLLGIPEGAIRRALDAFRGVQRRFSLTGEVDGVRIIDDYAHHPTEIAAVLATARLGACGRVMAVMQPHRYTRLSALLDDFAHCFDEADKVLIAPVYAAGEAPIAGASRDALVAAARAGGHRDVAAIDGPDDLARRADAWAAPGDTIVCLGAGSITSWARALPDTLREARK
ncbi:MAG: UDP-N-acetylmuramate--L-alanine ligase [Alphaproteobacteria bacterium]|nr:UDP-N-acetylmuramate--L-alanine ligase [Alphaproteobacteria bacterium]